MNERRSRQDQTLNNVSFNARCGLPDLLQGLVRFPESLLIEQIDSFSQHFLFPSRWDTGLNGS